VSKKIEDAYNKEVAPFIEALKKLSGQEFTLTAQDLILELHTYDAKFNTYPVSIKSKKPFGGVLIACNANIPIPKTEARTFKQHFDNNILRPELSGNFQSTEFFRVAQAYVIDDASNKKYDLFASKFVDLGNGIVYDSVTKLLWLKDTNYFKLKETRKHKQSKHKQSWRDAKTKCDNLTVAGLSGWRLPTKEEVVRMCSVYHGQEPHPFVNLKRSYWVADREAYGVDVSQRKYSYPGTGISLDLAIWCVRGRE
jgi:hypothetical protein